MTLSQAKFEISFLEKRLLHLQSLPASSSSLPPSLPLPVLALELARKSFQLSQTLIQAKNYAKAETFLLKARKYTDPAHYSFESSEWQVLRVRILAFLGKTFWKLGKWEEAGVLFGKLDRHLKVERMLKNQEGEELVESLELVWVGMGKVAFRRGEVEKVKEVGKKAEEVIKKLRGGGGGEGMEGRVRKIYRVYFKCLLYAALLEDKDVLNFKLASLLAMASEKLPANDRFLIKVSQLPKKLSSSFLQQNILPAKSPIHKISPIQSPKKTKGSEFPQKDLNFKSKLFEIRKFSQPSSLPHHPTHLIPSSSSLPRPSLPPPLQPPSSSFLLFSSSGVMLSKRPIIIIPPPSSLLPPPPSRICRSPKNNQLNSSMRQNSQMDSDIMEKSIHLSMRRGRNSLKTVFRLDEEEEEEEGGDRVDEGLNKEEEEWEEEGRGREEEDAKLYNSALKIQMLWRKRMRQKRVAVELEKDNLLTYKLNSKASMYNFGIEKRIDLIEGEVEIKSPFREIREEDIETLNFKEIKVPGGIQVKGVEVKVGGVKRREKEAGRKEGGAEEDRKSFGYKVHLQAGTERFDIFGSLGADLMINNKYRCIWFLINRIMEEGFGKEEEESRQNNVASKEELEKQGINEDEKKDAGLQGGKYFESDEKQALLFIKHLSSINKRYFYNKNRIVGSTRRKTEEVSLNFHRNYLHDTKKAFWNQRKTLIRTIITLSKLF